MLFCEASFSAHLSRADGPAGSGRSRAYTPAMRRWVCVIALLFGFAGEGYAWTVRPSIPVPIERQITGRDGRRTPTTGYWWRAA
jgi:hypothetical protein